MAKQTSLLPDLSVCPPKLHTGSVWGRKPCRAIPVSHGCSWVSTWCAWSAKGEAQNPWSKAPTADSKFLCICEAGPQGYTRSQKGCEIWFIDNWLFIDRVGEIGTRSTNLWLLLYVLSSLAEAEEKGHPLQCNVAWESFCTLKWMAKEIPQQLVKYVKIIWISVTAKGLY